jgi:hypothetical protein
LRDRVIFREGDDYPMMWRPVEGLVAHELEPPVAVLRVPRLHAGDIVDCSAVPPHAGKQCWARAVDAVTAPAFEGAPLLASFGGDSEFALAVVFPLMGVVSERLRATCLQLLDIDSPEVKRAGHPKRACARRGPARRGAPLARTLSFVWCHGPGFVGVAQQCGLVAAAQDEVADL